MLDGVLKTAIHCHMNFFRLDTKKIANISQAIDRREEERLISGDLIVSKRPKQDKHLEDQDLVSIRTNIKI